MGDRICQQAIRQILEPICEAKFNKHSYGFRPLRSTENAIADVTQRINLGKLGNLSRYQRLTTSIIGECDKHYGGSVSEIPESFRSYNMKADIREPDGKVVKAEMGTPQGGLPAIS